MQRGHILWLLVGALAVALTLQPSVAGAQSPRAPQPRIYLALGDSLAFGQGATDPRFAYVPRLFRFFQAPGNAGVDTLVNLGSPGETSASMVTGGQLAEAINEILHKDVRVVTLDIGANDFLTLLNDPLCQQDPFGLYCQGLVKSRLLTFETNYNTIVASIRNAINAKNPSGTSIQFLAMTYYNPLWVANTNTPLKQALDRVLEGKDGVENCSALADTDNIGVNDIIRCVGAQVGSAKVANVYPSFQHNTQALTLVTQQPPDFHPTDAGYAVIASDFIQASH